MTPEERAVLLWVSTGGGACPDSGAALFDTIKRLKLAGYVCRGRRVEITNKGRTAMDATEFLTGDLEKAIEQIDFLEAEVARLKAAARRHQKRNRGNR